jgi:6-pyruvoyltetrahydropterin/6-carboxytetrahydropterin synthase
MSTGITRIIFMFKIETSIEFDAAHFLLNTNTQCDVLHGHRWKVIVILKSEELNDNGFVLNFSTLKQWIDEIVKDYDHNLLNYYLEQPTAENLAYTIWRHLHKRLWQYNHKKPRSVEIESVRISETPNNSASFILNDIDVKQESARRAALKMWADEETRGNLLCGLREASKDPVLRKFRRDRMRENNPMNDRDCVEKMLQSLKKSQKQCPNKEEKQIIEFFKTHNIPLRFVGNGDFVLNGKIPDFVDLDKKLIVEYNGRFWHSDNNKWYDVKDDSQDRIEMFKGFGYRTYIIWSDVFKKDPDKVLDDIRQLYEV